MRRLRLAIALVVALGLAGACSAPLDSGPKAIGTDSIPVGLRGETAPTTSTTVPSGATEEVTVYFIKLGEGRLEPVKRRVSSPVNAEKVLERLFAGPNPVEASSGLYSAISGDTDILHADVEASILTVDTSKNFAFGPVPDQISAFAQVVYTALDLNGVIGVQFAQNGKRISVQAGDGSSTSAPLGKAPYAQFAPR